MTPIKLSILVPTVPSRMEFFYPRLMKQLLEQTAPYDNVEIISIFDNKKRSIGAKRITMLQLVQGEYVVSVDDDDRLAADYVSSIMEALEANPGVDCVVFNFLTTDSRDSGPKLCQM